MPITFLCLITMGVIFFVRLPSYTIQTTGKLYVVNKVSRTVQVIDLSNGKQVAEIPIAMESHEVVTTNGENSVVLTNYGAEDSQGNVLKVINTKKDHIEKTITLHESISVNGICSLTKPDQVALVDYANSAVLLLNLQTGHIEQKWHTQQKGSHLVARHPTKPLVYVTSNQSKSVTVINMEAKEAVKSIPCGRNTESIAVTPDGQEIWATNKENASIMVIDATAQIVTDTLSTGVEPLKIAFSVDGKYALVTNAMDGNIFVYDRWSRARVKTVQLHGKTTILERVLYHTPYPVNILMHPNGLYAFISNSNANKVEVLDMNSFEIVSTLGTGKIPDALAFIE